MVKCPGWPGGMSGYRFESCTTANITISPAKIYVNVYLLPKKKNTSCEVPSKAIESCKVHRTKELLTLIVPENCNLILELRPILYSVVIYCSHAKLS